MNHQFPTLRQLTTAWFGTAFGFIILLTVPFLNSSAQASDTFTISMHPLPLAVTAGRVKADAKEFEGKTQESIGNVTGNQGDRLAGKVKQAEGKVRSAVEDVKDKAGMG